MGKADTTTSGPGDYDEFADPVAFGESQTMDLPAEAASAEKRGFADFDGDGLTDMVEVRDDKWGFGQEWSLTWYPAKRGDDGIGSFGSGTKVKVDLRVDFFRSGVKFDTADVDGDGWADLILTEFFDRFRDDEFKVLACLNRREIPLSFYCTESLVAYDLKTGNPEKVAMARLMIIYAGKYSYTTQKNIDNYLKMDWADMDGDGRDDLVLMWRIGFWHNHMAVDVFYSEGVDEEDNVVFAWETGNTKMEEALEDRTANTIDTEDFDGDGRADILVYDRDVVGSDVNLRLALNTAKSRTHLAFEPHRDFVVKRIPFDKMTFFKKSDSFDVDLDGCADYVHAGLQDKKPMMQVNLYSGCSSPGN